MIRLSAHAQSILDGLNDRYASQTYKRYYGKSTYRNWQLQLSNIISSLEYQPNKFGLGLLAPTDWGQIEYSRIRRGDNIKIIVNNFHFNFRHLHDWFTSAVYPPTTISRSRTTNVNSINFVKPYRYINLPNGERIYAIQSDTHLYSLADKGKQQVINYWFSSLSFPMNTRIGNLNIIGNGTINKIPYYIDTNLQLHHAAEIAALEKNRHFESKQRTNVIRLTESQFKKMLVGCISKILKEIA